MAATKVLARPRGETAPKELAETKRENQQLKKQVRRLQKQISKIIEAQGGVNPSDGSPAEAPESLAASEAREPSAGGCSKCSGLTKDLRMPNNRTLRCCTVCGHRVPVVSL